MAGFFDKVVVGLNKGVNTVSEGSKLIVEKANLNTQIKDTEREKNRLLQNMGTLVYNLHANGEIEIEQCIGMCTEISAMDQKIMALQQQLQALEMPKMILSIIVGTFSSNIHTLMRSYLRSHSTAAS